MRALPHVRPAVPADAPALAPRLRAADVREIRAATGLDPTVVLALGVARSAPCYAVVEAGAPIALFGAAPSDRDPRFGIVWLLASDALAAHALPFARRSRAWLSRLREHYPVLGNFVDARNQLHLRWLRFCGFTFVRRIERYGVEQRPFYEVRLGA